MKRLKHLTNIHVVIWAVFFLIVLVGVGLTILNVATNNPFNQTFQTYSKILFLYACAVFLFYINIRLGVRSRIIACVCMLCAIYFFFGPYLPGNLGHASHNFYLIGGRAVTVPNRAAILQILCPYVLFGLLLVWVLSAWKDMAVKMKRLA